MKPLAAHKAVGLTEGAGPMRGVVLNALTSGGKGTYGIGRGPLYSRKRLLRDELQDSEPHFGWQAGKRFVYK